MTGLALGLPPEEARGELERTHLLVSHLASEIDALGQAQERYRRECEEQELAAQKLRQELAALQVSNGGGGKGEVGEMAPVGVIARRAGSLFITAQANAYTLTPLPPRPAACLPRLCRDRPAPFVLPCRRTPSPSTQADNAGLVHRVAREKEIRERAQEDKARLQQEIEFDSERIFNSCSGRSSVPGARHAS
jgi:hypothetical protein